MCYKHSDSACEGKSPADGFVSLASIRHSILDIMIYCEIFIEP